MVKDKAFEYGKLLCSICGEEVLEKDRIPENKYLHSNCYHKKAGKSFDAFTNSPAFQELVNPQLVNEKLDWIKAYENALYVYVYADQREAYLKDLPHTD